MIIGISGTGRKDGITYNAIKKILEETGEEYEIISLAGKKVNGCIACLACTNDNRCKIKDDFQEIQKKFLEADGIVFGGADYFGTLNALAHATLERTFAFRHNDRFELEGKPAIIVTTSYKAEEDNSVYNSIKRFFEYNKIKVIGSVNAKGYSQCYSCTNGYKCVVGNVVKDNGLLKSMDEAKYPLKFNEQLNSINQCLEGAMILKKEVEKYKAIKAAMIEK